MKSAECVSCLLGSGFFPGQRGIAVVLCVGTKGVLKGPHHSLCQEMVLRLWQHLVSQGRVADSALRVQGLGFRAALAFFPDPLREYRGRIGST